MVYYKLILDERRFKEDQIYPVIVRITHNRKNSSLATGIRIRKDYWNSVSYQVERSAPNYQYLNTSISDFYVKVQKIIHRLEDDNSFSFEALKERMSPKYKVPQAQGNLTFKAFADKLINDMLSINQSGNAIVYQTTTNRFLKFATNPKLKFIDINYSLLEDFKRHLMKDGMKQNTISNYFRTLRAIYNKAIKAKLVDRSHYPFLDITIKTERTAKRAVTIDTLVKIATHELKPKSKQWHARNYFLLSFALTGASFTDLAYLTSDNIKKGRLIYRRRKTGKELSIKLQPFTERLLAYYDGMNSKYLLPVLPSGVIEDSMNAKRAISQWIKTTNKWLAKLAEDCRIEDEITTYVARHTWATTAKRLGFSIELIAEAMGHEHGNKITNIYLDTFDQSVIDEVTEKVITVLFS
jgi:integrase/recombinase XerD